MIRMKREKGIMLPYEYNYYLSIGIYSKLSEYQERIKKLHDKNQPGIHTFSNIISHDVKRGVNGLNISNGFFVMRTIDMTLSAYFRLGLAVDPLIRINDVIYRVNRIVSLKEPDIKEGELKFKSLSPILIRDFDLKKKYVDAPERVEDNLNKGALWILRNFFGLSDDETRDFHICTSNLKRKTVRISNSKAKEAITTAYEMTGEIKGSERAIRALYYRGLGSKPSLGLGCWEVI